MSTDYKPNSLAIKIIRLFLANRHLVVSADRLADMFGTTAKNIRQTLAQAIGRNILRKEFNDLTGEQDYAAGLKIGEMEHLQPTAQEQVQHAEAAADQEAAPALAASAATAEECSGVAEAIHYDAELVDIGTGTEMPASRIDLDDLVLCDIPAPTGRAGAISRYDGHSLWQVIRQPAWLHRLTLVCSWRVFPWVEPRQGATASGDVGNNCSSLNSLTKIVLQG